MSQQINWKPKLTKVSEIKNWEQNPRSISKEAYERLKQRITSRGFHDVIKLDTNNVVLSGNQRRRALEELGVKEVYCMVPSRKLTEEEMLQVAVDSNRQDGAWDFDMLSSLSDIEALKELGFTDQELKLTAAPDVINDISLPDGERPGLQQITFTLTNEQMEAVKGALETAKKLGDFINTGNENKNGNAIARICEDYVSYGE